MARSPAYFVMDIIVGTAGHIDHGKTALVKALTGVDADRLPEEKRRGITVDLGFAEMSVAGAHFGFVDVPGHERFVKNMLAGASGIDIVMLVIAADEGVMPQTREHFDICRLLGVSSGIIVLTKTDMVDAETLELAKLEAAELVSNSFLENAPVISVSSQTGEGIDALKETLVERSANLPHRDDGIVTRLPIDRSFSMKGFGAVVTGTLASGTFKEGDEMTLLPDDLRVRVRGLQTHGQAVKSAAAGQRVAVNLGGIDHSKVTRGMTVTEPDVLRPTQILDAEIEVLPGAPKPLRSRQRVRIHLGTVEALARIQVMNDSGEIAAGDKDFVQIRFERSVVAIPGERFIVRSYSPQATIAGGQVLDNSAAKHRYREIPAVRKYLHDLMSASGDNIAKLIILVRAAGYSGLSFAEFQTRTAMRMEVLTAAISANLASGSIVDADGRYITRQNLESLLSLAETGIQDFHKREPLTRGITREALRERAFAHLPPEVFQSVIASLQSAATIIIDKDTIRWGSYQTQLSPAEAAVSERILVKYNASGLAVPSLNEALAESIQATNFTPQDARKFFQLFLDSGEIVKVADEFYFARIAIDDLTASLREFAAKTRDRLIDVAQFKELAGISRKYAIPLLEYFDRERITRRAADKRIIL